MARIRTIKPEFPESESMGRISRDARLCFIMLWTISDDAGRLRGNSRMLASLLFPYDDDAKELMPGWLDELEAEGCILRYVVGKDSYIQIENWLAHQKVDKPSPSKIPAPEEAVANPRESSRILTVGPRTKDQGPEDQGEDQDHAPGKPATACGRRFEQFWSAYPRKQAKGAAEKVWNRLRPDDQLLQAMLTALSWQTRSPAWLKDGGQFIPQPATWLNAKRWEDEIGAGIVPRHSGFDQRDYHEGVSDDGRF